MALPVGPRLENSVNCLAGQVLNFSWERQESEKVYEMDVCSSPREEEEVHNHSRYVDPRNEMATTMTKAPLQDYHYIQAPVVDIALHQQLESPNVGAEQRIVHDEDVFSSQLSYSQETGPETCSVKSVIPIPPRPCSSEPDTKMRPVNAVIPQNKQQQPNTKGSEILVAARESLISVCQQLLGDAVMNIKQFFTLASRSNSSTFRRECFQSRQLLLSRDRAVLKIILVLSVCLMSSCSAEVSCTLPAKYYIFEDESEVLNFSVKSETRLHLNESTCTMLLKTTMCTFDRAISDWCKKIALKQYENCQKSIEKIKKVPDLLIHQKISRAVFLQRIFSEYFKNVHNTTSNTVWINLGIMDLMQSYFVNCFSAMDSGKAFVGLVLIVLGSAPSLYIYKKCFKESNTELMKVLPTIEPGHSEPPDINLLHSDSAVQAEEEDCQESMGSASCNEDLLEYIAMQKENATKQENSAALNVLDLKTQTMQEVDGSLDIRNELEIGDDSKYEELDIYVRAEDSNYRAFLPEEVLVYQTASLLPNANLLSGNVLVKTTNNQNASVKTKQQFFQEEDSSLIPDFADTFKSAACLSMKCMESPVVSNQLFEMTTCCDKETTPPPVLNNSIDGFSNSLPPKEVKNIRLNVVPTQSVSGIQLVPIRNRHKATNQLQRQCDFEDKHEKSLMRNATWLPLDQLPRPKLDKIFTVFYNYEQFPALSSIISQIAEGKSPRPQVTMMYELLRICTLRTYPRDNKPFLLKYAAAGFYYASDGDGVVCYCCGIRRYGWVEADDPMEVHKRINPRCKFIINNIEHNVPAIADGPLRQTVARLDMIPECIRAPSPGEDVNNSQRTRTGVQMAIPKHPHMAIKTVREQSFNGNWPNTPKYSPVQLADGGFFFTDLGDCVRCFFCGIGLRHWDKDDDMWVEHARWSQNCTFLIQKKGQNFVDLVQLAVEQLDDSDQSSNTLYKNLVSEASQKVLDQSEYTPQQIKQAIVAMLAIDSNSIVTVTSLKQKVAEQILASDTNIIRSEGIGDAAEPPARNSVVTNEPSDIDRHDPEDIKQENEQLKEQTLCKVCLDNIVSIVFLPCGHLVTCADCAPALRKCPICRADVKGTVRTRMS